MRLLCLYLAGVVCALAVGTETRVDRGFEHFNNLEYGAALEIFRDLVKEHPGNPDFHNHVAQTILYRELFRVGALESELVSGNNSFLRRPKMEPSEADQLEFEDAVASALRLCDARLAEDPDDIAALFAQGVTHGLKSNYDFLVRKAWMDSLRSATNSRKSHQRVVELDPSNIDARMIPALHNYVVSLLPWYMRALGFLAGFRGDKEGGIRELELVAERGDTNRHNARFLLAVLYRREQRPGDAVPLLQGLMADFPRNWILPMELVQMYSDLKEKEKGLEVVRRIERRKMEPAPGYDRMPMYKLWYTRGTLLFWYDDFDKARADFRRMVAVQDGMNLHEAQLAWFRLGQIEDILGNRAAAVAAYRRVNAMAQDSERADQANKYLRKPCTRETRL